MKVSILGFVISLVLLGILAACSSDKAGVMSTKHNDSHPTSSEIQATVGPATEVVDPGVQPEAEKVTGTVPDANSSASEQKTLDVSDSTNTIDSKVAPEGIPEKPIHTDVFDLDGQKYSVLYWNEGEFDYTRFAIMKQDMIVFDSQEQGVTFEGGAGGQTDGESWSTGLVYNGHAVFLFDLVDNRPDPYSILIEEVDDEIKLTIRDNIELDFALTKGVPELFGFPSYGQMPLSPALDAVYVWQSDHYEVSASLTQQYWEKELHNRQLAFKQEPNEMRLDSLLSAYLLLNRIEDGRQWLEEYSQNDTSSDKEYLQTYKDYLNDKDMVNVAQYEHWMDKLPPLANGDKLSYGN
ncbi:hypothetical protein [Paenibacillus glycinis]|uniref:Uncharacterized protein n=1 Tax=Paenibacillus glycinis TaxID=2697035 RepID=A0ABW9XZK4_9BACL|nr:hypothetical protein [Paenibacillus glycinis]NBD28157.1 hypothetical protein [Paenibacillus glycinis]